jgi:hypothetical protein
MHFRAGDPSCADGLTNKLHQIRRERTPSNPGLSSPSGSSPFVVPDVY